MWKPRSALSSTIIWRVKSNKKGAQRAPFLWKDIQLFFGSRSSRLATTAFFLLSSSGLLGLIGTRCASRCLFRAARFFFYHSSLFLIRTSCGYASLFRAAGFFLCFRRRTVIALFSTNMLRFSVLRLFLGTRSYSEGQEA